MTFDYVVGNPPYQYPKSFTKSKNKKLYKDIVSRLLELDYTQMVMITPPAIVVKNKYLCLLNHNLTHVESTNEYFDIGQKTVFWVLSKDAKDVITHSFVQNPEHQEAMDIYDAIRTQPKYFLRNGPDDKNNTYPLHKRCTKNHVIYPHGTKKQSLIKLHQEQKICISATNAHKPDNIFITDKDMSQEYYFAKDVGQLENLKSFIYSEYFMRIRQDLIEELGTSFNVMIAYLPQIDFFYPWTNEMVEKYYKSIL